MKWFIIIVSPIFSFLVVANLIATRKMVETLLLEVAQHYERMMSIQSVDVERLMAENKHLKEELERSNDGEDWKKGKTQEG
jgi:hypothetical protein